MRLVVATVLGVTAGWVFRARLDERRRAGDVAASTAPPPPALPSSTSPPPTPPPTPLFPLPPGPESQRDQLVDACVWVYESSSSRAVQRRMRHTLGDVGVQLLQPEDGPFDPDLHERVGTEEAEGASTPDTIAKTLRAGVLDGGRLLRPAQVIVYGAARRGPTLEVLPDVDRS